MAVPGAEEEVKLLGLWASPFVIRVRIALNVKEIAYEFLEETFGSKSELLLKSNPVYKKMPVLIHNNKPICESMIIVQYIDEVWTKTGSSILPSEPHESALARFWAVYIDDKWFGSLFGVLKATDEEAKEEAEEQVVAGVQLLDKAFKICSKGKPFFGGDNIGYLDIAFGCSLGWIAAVEKLCDVELLDYAETPQLVGWAERFWSHDAVKGVIPETDKFVEVCKMLQARWSAESTQ